MPRRLQHAVCQVCLHLEHLGFYDAMSEVKQGHLKRLRVWVSETTDITSIISVSELLWLSMIWSIIFDLDTHTEIELELVDVVSSAETREEYESVCLSVIPREAFFFICP